MASISKTNQQKITKPYLRLLTVCIAGLISVSQPGCSSTDSTKGSTKGNVTERMQLVVDNLVESYNTLDSTGFRRHFGPRLLVDSPPAAIGQLLRERHEVGGLAKTIDIDASIDGMSATIKFHLEKQVFDIELKLDANGRMVQFDWNSISAASST